MFRNRPNDRRLAFAAFYVIPVDIKTISLQEFSSARIYSRFAEAMLSHWFQSWMTDQKPWAPQHDGLPFWIEKFAYIGANTQSPFSETLRLVEIDVFLRTTEQSRSRPTKRRLVTNGGKRIGRPAKGKQSGEHMPRRKERNGPRQRRRRIGHTSWIGTTITETIVWRDG